MSRTPLSSTSVHSASSSTTLLATTSAFKDGRCALMKRVFVTIVVGYLVALSLAYVFLPIKWIHSRPPSRSSPVADEPIATRLLGHFGTLPLWLKIAVPVALWAAAVLNYVLASFHITKEPYRHDTEFLAIEVREVEAICSSSRGPGLVDMSASGSSPSLPTTLWIDGPPCPFLGICPACHNNRERWDEPSVMSA